MLRVVLPAVAIAIACIRATPAERVDAAAVLRTCGGMTDADLVRLNAGSAVARTLASEDRREIAVTGALRIEVPSEFFVKRLRDIAAFKRSEMVLQIGRFSDPPSMNDLASLTIDDADVEALRRCRVGDCGVKLSAPAIERFRTEINWRTADGKSQARDLVKRMLLEITVAYLNGGDQALADDQDKRRPVSPSRDLRALVKNLDCSQAAVPEIYRYLVEFPNSRPDGAESFTYWSKEAFGLKPFISLTQVIVYRPRPDGPTVVATKGLYSAHYMDASVAFTWLLNTRIGDEPAVDMLYVNRSRADALGGAFGGLARSIVAGRQRDGMVKELKALKARLESDWRTAPDGRRSLR